MRDSERANYRIAEWPQSRMAAGDWFPTQLVMTECVEFFQNLESGEWFPTSKDMYVDNLGPVVGRYAARQPRKRFVAPLRHLESQNLYSNHYGGCPGFILFYQVKIGQGRDCRSYWERRGSVMLPERLSVPNTIATALHADNWAVGSAFAPYHPIAGDHDQERVNKACVAYLKSSSGHNRVAWRNFQHENRVSELVGQRTLSHPISVLGKAKRRADRATVGSV